MTTQAQAKELWQAIPGYEGLYEVSTEGRVKTVHHFMTITNKFGKTFDREYQEKILTGQQDRRGLSTLQTK